MKFYELRRSFFRKKLQIRRHFATKCTIRGTRGAKLPVDATFSGRSMVEMLGVLAIIGVLSVGAISGYSKAMMKYRLNKQAEALNLLLANSIQLSRQLPKSPSGWTYYNEMLQKLNLLPDTVYYDKTSDRLFDIFKNNIRFYSNSSSEYSYGLIFSLSNTTASFEVCQNIINVGKAFSSELLRLERNDNTSEAYVVKVLWGDKECTANRTCLKDVSLDDISNICEATDKDNTYFTFGFAW